MKKLFCLLPESVYWIAQKSFMLLKHAFFYVAGFCLLNSTLQAQTNKDLDDYMYLHDSLMRQAYERRDLKTYNNLFDNFSSKYSKMPVGYKAKFKKEYTDALYNLCCIYSLRNDRDNAVTYLEKTIKAGYTYFAHIKEDTDLKNIREDEKYKKITDPLFEIQDYCDRIDSAKKKGLLDSIVLYSQLVTVTRLKNIEQFPEGTEALSLAELGYFLWWTGNYAEALKTYFKALEKAEPVNNPLVLGEVYNGIAMVYRNQGNYREAINYYSKTEALNRPLPFNKPLYSAIIDKGKAYEQLGILDSARQYIEEWIAATKKMPNGRVEYGGGGEAEMGIIKSKENEKESAEIDFKKAFQLLSERDEVRLLARAYCEFAEHFDRFHQPDSAIHYATKGFELDKQNNLLVQQLAASTLLAKLYKGKNKIDSAFKYLQISTDLRDSVFSSEKISSIQMLSFNNKLREQEAAVKKTADEESRRRNIQYFLIAAGLISFIIGFLLLSRKFITSTRLISFLGVVALLFVFEFINLLLHPFLEDLTHHSPLLILLILVGIAALLVPLHHKLEKWAIEKLVEKNRQIRLAAAKRTIEKLEGTISVTDEDQ